MGRLAGAVAVGLLCTVAAIPADVPTASATAQSTFGWSAPISIDAQAPVVALSCPSTSFCIGVDTQGNVVTFDGTTWTAPAAIDAGAVLSSVSCPTTTFCVAVDKSGNALTFDGESWSVPMPIDPGNPLFAVSCATPDFCAAVGGNGHVIVDRSGTWAAPLEIDTTAGTGYRYPNWLLGIACPSSSFCVTYDFSGLVLTYNGSTWSPPTVVENTGGYQLTAVSCASPSYCKLVDSAGDVSTYADGSWTKTIDYPGPGSPDGVPVDALSCPSSTMCVAAQVDAFFYDGNAWSLPDNAVGTIVAVSCPTPTFCVASQQNDAVTWSAAPSNTTASVQPGAVAFQQTTVDVTVTGGVTGMGAITPSGTVVVSGASGGSCEALLSGDDGVATGSCQVTEYTSGTFILAANYQGDDNFAMSYATAPLTVGTTPSTTKITAVAPGLVAGGTTTVDVTIGPVIDLEAPTGIVRVADEDSSCSIKFSSGQTSGSCSFPTLSAGSDELVATYSGDDTFSPSTSSPVEVSIGKGSISNLLFGQASGAETGPVEYFGFAETDGADATGAIVLTDSEGGSCTMTLNGGRGTCWLTQVASDSPYTVQASYSGDANWDAAIASEEFTIGLGRPHVVLTAPYRPANGPVEYTVSVTGAGPEPTGTVDVSDGAGGTCTVNLSDANGSCSIDELVAANYSVSANFSGDANYTAAAATLVEGVGLLTPTVVLSGQSDALTGLVSYSATVIGGETAPTGTVVVTDGAGGTCSIALEDDAGSCSIVESAAAGPFSVEGAYSGDADYYPTTASTIETVAPGLPTVDLHGETGAPTGPVAYEVTVGGPAATPTGSVSIADGTGASCRVILQAGAGTCSIAEAAGDSPYTVTADYAGDENYQPASATVAEAIIRGVPTVEVSGPSSPPTGPVEYSVSVSGSGSPPTGSVVLTDSQGGSCTATLASSAGECSIDEDAAGIYAVTASYEGDDNYLPTAVGTSEIVGLGVPTIELAGGPSPTTGPVTFTVTVSGSGQVPTGTVAVSDGKGGACTVTLSGGGGSCVIDELAADSAYTVEADYSGDGAYVPASARLDEVVGRATPLVTVSGPAGAVTGPVSYRVTVDGPGPYPTGDVVVSDGDGGSCTISLVTASGGTGACSIVEGASNGFPIIAVYQGDGNYTFSAATSTEEVGVGNVELSVDGPSHPVTGEVFYTATVRGDGPTPIGSVVIYDGSYNGVVPISCTALLTDGSGACDLVENAADSPYAVTADYGGDPNYSAATTTVTELVGRATPEFSISETSPPATAGAVAYSAYLQGNGWGVGPSPTGTVTVSDGHGGSCTMTTPPSLTCAIDETAADSPYAVTATYSGDANWMPATSSYSAYVERATPALTATASPSPAKAGAVTYHATVSGSGDAVPTGTVAVTDGKGGICTVTLSGGSGSCAIEETAAGGPYTLVATYSGDARYAGATTTFRVIVAKASPTLHASARASGTRATFEATVAGAIKAVALSGRVMVTDGRGHVCKITLKAGTGSCSITEMAGTYKVRFTYSGNANYDGKAASVKLTVR